MLFAAPPQPPLEDDPPPNPQPYAGDILVRAATNRPNCDFAESFIDAYNQGGLHYRILVERTYENNDDGPGGPCIDCADNPCGVNNRNGLGQLMCSTTRDRNGPLSVMYELSPAGAPNSCRSQVDCFPNPLNPCGTHCDNLHTNPSCPSQAATCGTANEWCGAYSDIFVTIVEYKAPSWMVPGDTWHAVNPPLVVCVSGASEAPPNQNARRCLVDDYCAPAFGDRHALAGQCNYTFLPD
jgi:hypothetical protein